MKNTLQTLLLILALAIPALAQGEITTETVTSKLSAVGGDQIKLAGTDKPVTAKPAPPAEVKFTKEQADESARLADKAKLAALETENLALKVERAQLDLQKLRETAAAAQTAYVEKLRAIAEALGISKDELPNYEYDDRGPVPILRRKEVAKPEPKGKGNQ